MFLIRFLFKLAFWALFIAAGYAGYLYFQYKPLIECLRDPEKYLASAPGDFSYSEIPARPLAANTVDARNLSIRRESPTVQRPAVPVRPQVPALPSSLPAEAQPYRSRIEQELAAARNVPLRGLLGYARSKINWARGKLDEGSSKLSRANPQDPAKQAKVAKARALVPKAYGLLNRAESLLNRLAAFQIRQ